MIGFTTTRARTGGPLVSLWRDATGETRAKVITREQGRHLVVTVQLAAPVSAAATERAMGREIVQQLGHRDGRCRGCFVTGGPGGWRLVVARDAGPEYLTILAEILKEAA
jgi:hypothetical protein